MVSVWSPVEGTRVVILYSLATLLSLWIVLMYLGTGSILFRLLRVPTLGSFPDVILKMGVGFGITGNILMVLAFLQKATPGVILIVLLIQTAFITPLLFVELVTFYKQRRLLFTTLKKLLSIPGIALGLIVGLYALRSLLPPTGFDALMYHLSTVDLVLRHGGFYDIFFNPQSDFPMLTEMNYMIGIALDNDIVCRQIAFLTFILSLSATVLVCRFIELTHRNTVLALLLFATATTTIAAVPQCDVDYALVSWIVFALFLFYQGQLKKNSRILLIAAIFAGMAMQTKIIGCFVIPLGVAVLLRYKKIPDMRIIVSVVIMLLLMTLPWYIKSFMHNGSIVPITTATLVGQGLGNPMGLVINNDVVYAFVNVIVRTVAAPWSFSLMPSQHQGDTLGPLLIAMLPFLLLVPSSGKVKWVVLLTGIYALQVLIMEMAYIKGGSSIRYSIFVLVAGIPVTIAILSTIRTVYPRIGAVVMVAITIQIVLGSVLIAKRYHLDWKAIACNYTREKYLKLILPEYAIIHFINTQCRDGVVLTSYNYSNYYIKQPYMTLYKNYQDGTGMDQDLKRFGVKYLFANDKLDTTANRSAFSQISNKTLLKSQNGFYCFKID